MKSYQFMSRGRLSCSACFVSVTFLLLQSACAAPPPRQASPTINITAQTTPRTTTPDVAASSAATAEVTPTQYITPEFGVAIQGYNTQDVSLLEIRPVQAISVTYKSNEGFFAQVSALFTGTVTLELALAQDETVKGNNWLLYYAPSTLSLTTPQSWREYITYKIDPPAEYGETSESLFDSSYLITRTIPLSTVVGSEVTTTLLGWTKVLDSNGFRLDKTARLLFRHEMEGHPVERILIATSLNNLGVLPPPPDTVLICGVNRKGSLICKIIHLLGL